MDTNQNESLPKNEILTPEKFGALLASQKYRYLDDSKATK